MENTNIGTKIQKLRESLNLTQKELADKVGITDATLSRYENNKREPKAEILARMAKVLNVTTDYLIGRTDNKSSKVYTTTLDNHTYTIEIDKGVQREITQDELNLMIKKLKAVGFDVNKLLEDENSN